MTDPLVIDENLNQNPTNFNGVSMVLPKVIKPVVTHLSHQDRLLAFYKWVGMPLKPKATVLLVHGLGEHMGRTHLLPIFYKQLAMQYLAMTTMVMACRQARKVA